jgi:hypothetical protein
MAVIDDDGLDAAVAAADALAYNKSRNTGNIHLPKTPTIAVFVEGGLIQDICFDGAVRVVVIDFDEENDDPDDDRMADYTTPEGDVIRVGLSVWTRSTTGANWASDASTVRAALRAAGEV